MLDNISFKLSKKINLNKIASTCKKEKKKSWLINRESYAYQLFSYKICEEKNLCVKLK